MGHTYIAALRFSEWALEFVSAPPVLLRIRYRRDQFRLGGAKATTVPHAPLEVVSLARSYSSAVLRGRYRCGSARSQSGHIPYSTLR